MSMNDFEVAAELVRRHPEIAIVPWRPCSQARIAEAERALGMTLPPTYRRFLAEFGNLHLRGYEGIDGVSPEGNIDEPKSAAVWETLEQRAKGWIPPGLVVIAADGMGDYYALDGRFEPPGAELPVIVWAPWTTNRDSSWEVDAPDFGAFFHDVVEHLVTRRR